MSGDEMTDQAMVQHEGVELVVNGRKLESRAQMLADLIKDLGLADAKVATAVNGQFVPEARRATTTLGGGDRIEIVSARQGG